MDSKLEEMEARLREVEIERDQARMEFKVERQVSESSACKLANLSAHIEKLKSRLDEVECELGNERELASEQISLVQARQAECDTLRVRLDQTRAELTEARHANRSLEERVTQNDELKAACVSLESQVGELNETVEAMRREWEAEKRGVEEERAEWTAKSRQLVECIVQLDETSSLLTQYRQACQDIESKYTELVKVSRLI